MGDDSETYERALRGVWAENRAKAQPAQGGSARAVDPHGWAAIHAEVAAEMARQS